VQLPQRSAARGAPRARSRSVTTSPRKNPGAVLGVEEAPVLPPRPEPAAARPRLLGDGAGVHVDAGLEGAALRAQALDDTVETRLHHVVVVVAQA